MRITEQQVYALLQIAQDSLRVDDLQVNAFTSGFKDRCQLVDDIVGQQNNEIMEIGESSLSSKLDIKDS